MSRYLSSLMFGIIPGLIFPEYASVWLLLLLPVIFMVIELIGKSGFGGHWCGYRFCYHMLYSLPFVCVLIGFFFASGRVGISLVFIGKLISR